MNLVVLDTNVVSFLMRSTFQQGQGDSPLAEAYRPVVDGKALAISFMTVGELFEGAYRAAWRAEKLLRLENVLRSYLVLPASPTVCRAWARIRSERKAQPISVDDAWIAAAAVSQGCPLVTHNGSDFLGISGLTVISRQA